MQLALVCCGRLSHFLSERSGDARSSPTMVEFLDFIFEQGLMDIPLVGGSFMWSNNRGHPSWFIIDRSLISLELKVQFPDLTWKRLPRLCSECYLQPRRVGLGYA